MLNVQATAPSSVEALPPSTGAASKDVPRTVKTLMASLHFTVLRAFPVRVTYQCVSFKKSTFNNSDDKAPVQVPWRIKRWKHTSIDGSDKSVRRLDLDDL